MKRAWTNVAPVICLVSMMVLMVAACGGGGDIVGTWSDDMGLEFEFTSDETLIISFMGQKMETEYSADGGKLSISGAEAAGIPSEIRYKVDGDELTLISPEGEEQTLQRK